MKHEECYLGGDSRPPIVFCNTTSHDDWHDGSAGVSSGPRRRCLSLKMLRRMEPITSIHAVLRLRHLTYTRRHAVDRTTSILIATDPARAEANLPVVLRTGLRDLSPSLTLAD